MNTLLQQEVRDQRKTVLELSEDYIHRLSLSARTLQHFSEMAYFKCLYAWQIKSEFTDRPIWPLFSDTPTPLFL